jgi:hypothetical protein
MFEGVFVPTDETAPRNWVERRALREGLLEHKSGDLWEQLRAAIMDACDSYNVNYPGQYGASVSHKLEDGKRIQVIHSNVPSNDGILRLITISTLISFDPQIPSVTATRENSSLTFRILADETHVYLTQAGKEIDIDEASRQMIEPILFPDNVRRKPVRIVPFPTGPGSWQSS